VTTVVIDYCIVRLYLLVMFAERWRFVRRRDYQLLAL